MLETLRCPGCSTRFTLTPQRVRPGIRRAKCYRCDAVFGIEDVVARLLEPIAVAGAEPPAAPQPVEPPVPAPEPMPAFTLDDLAGPQEGVLEPVPAEAEAEAGPQGQAATEPAAGPEEAYHPAGANYASAKDAIAKLMGKAPTPPQARTGSHNTMDVEATLDALESTLGGVPARTPEAPAAPRQSDLSSTVRLTSEEIKVALATAGDPSRTAPIAALPPVVPHRIENPPAPFLAPEPAQSPDLLKVQLEQETCNNVTVEQMAAWIEAGRVQEFHLVARQFSDHWIEASKVPSLRPVFERVRKRRGGQVDAPPTPTPEPQPVKRSLFGGLFGRN